MKGIILMFLKQGQIESKQQDWYERLQKDVDMLSGWK